MNTEFHSHNELWSHLLVEELVRCGVKLFVLSPGSRSTPLALAVASNPDIDKVVHYDERGAAFFAVGYARATLSPVALICTSGTATANYYPAVMEASNDLLPLILLTADRPPELQECGANQTINQAGLYDKHCRYGMNFDCPEADTDYLARLTSIDEAIIGVTGSNSGPVHLNLMFREPLAPETDSDPMALPSPLTVWACSTKPLSDLAPAEGANPAVSFDNLVQKLGNHHRVLIVAGRLLKPEDQRAVRRLAEVSGWPLVADVLSGLRLGFGGENLITYHDILIACGGLDALEFDAVLHVGRWPTSKRLLQFLTEHRPSEYYKIQEFPQRDDPGGIVTDARYTPIASACDALAESLSTSKASAVERNLKTLDTTIDKALDKSLERGALTEPGVARIISKKIAADFCLFVASSRPIRDMDSYGAASGAQVVVGGNRGVSGIDGTVASALGFARGNNLHPVILIGDLALLHDLNSLALIKEIEQPAIIVVINNSGGGIFSFLPVASQAEHFERFFAASHSLTFEHAAAMFGFDYQHPETVKGFTRSFVSAKEGQRSVIIEVTSDRRENAAVHAALLGDIRAKLNVETDG